MNLNYARRLLDKTKENFEKIAPLFSKTRCFPRPEMKYFVKRYVKLGQKVLDVGTGPGQFFELLKNKQIDYTGIDSSKTLIFQARKKYPQARFIVADAMNLRFKKEDFDLIFSFAFLHHIPSKSLRLKFLKNIYKLLKPKRYFICACWHSFAGRKMKYIKKFNILKKSGKSKLDFNDALVPWKNGGREILAEIYYHKFTVREIKSLFTDAGFKIKEFFYEKDGKKTKNNKADNLCIVGQKPLP
jgi:ubiquinone/menaquinone biosynthesis C-methylase UbiE